MDIDLASTFNAFLQHRERFIATAVAIADYSEARAETRVRPVVVLKTQQQLIAVKRDINLWQKYVDILITGDPDTYKVTAKVFNPIPVLVENVVSASVRVSQSTSSTKTIEKTKIITRMKNRLIKSKNNNELEQVVTINRELEMMGKDDETHYVRRAGGYSDTKVFIRFVGASEPEKLSATFSGLFIMPTAHNDLHGFLSMPDQSRQKQTRSDVFKNCLELSCCLYDAKVSTLYKQSDYLAAKQAREPIN
jgi:hypothetical protein